MEPSLKPKKILISALFSSLFISQLSAFAKDFYVDSEATLKKAVQEAATNDEDDVIYINANNIELTDPVIYAPDNKETYSITIKPASNTNGRVYIDRKMSESAFIFDFSKYKQLKKININISNIIFEDFYRNNDKRKSYFIVKGNNLHLKVDNCRFIRTNTKNSGGAFNINTNSSFVEFIDNVFIKNASDNSASSIYLKGEGNRIVIDKNKFISGKAKKAGAVYLDVKNGVVFFLNNTLLGNKLYSLSGENGGALSIYSKGTNIYMINNYFFANVGNTAGGGAYIESEDGYSYFYKNRFIYNYIRNEVGGGLYYKIKNGKADIVNNRFEYNISNSGAGFYVDSINSKLLVGNNITQQNMASNYSNYENKNGGGAVVNLEKSEILLANNTFYLNSASNYGGGIYLKSDDDSKVTLGNNIIWRNYSFKKENPGHDIYLNNEGTVSVLNNDYTFLSAKNNDLLELSGNIDNDPDFLNPYTGNFHLSSDSPCIDAGIVLENSEFSKIKEDIDGDDRIIGESVDIGADEFSGNDSTNDKKIIIIENPDKNERKENAPVYTEGYAVQTPEKIALVCVDLKPKKPIVSYSWDLDGDGYIDKKTKRSMITVYKSDIQNVRCLITYYDGTQALAKLDKK